MGELHFPKHHQGGHVAAVVAVEGVGMKLAVFSGHAT